MTQRLGGAGYWAGDSQKNVETMRRTYDAFNGRDLGALLAGIFRGRLGDSVVELGVRFPSSGGLIAYLTRGGRQRTSSRPLALPHR